MASVGVVFSWTSIYDHHGNWTTCLCCPSPTILPTGLLQHPGKADHLPLLSCLTIYHHHRCVCKLKVKSSHRKRAGFVPGQRMHGIWRIDGGGLNLRVRMDNLGWMNMLYSRALWKGFHSMPATECGFGEPSVAWEDAGSKYLFTIQDYILESWAEELED